MPLTPFPSDRQAGSLADAFGEDVPLAIHSAFREVKSLFSTPLEFVSWLKELRGAQWTIFPTFTGSAEDSAEHPPHFDASASGCWTGSIPLAALDLLGAESRSLHPTHSWVGWGPAWEEECLAPLLGRTPIGPGSPLRRLAEMGGKVVLLGVTLDALTLVHSAEEEAGVPYVLQPEPARCRLTRGAEVWEGDFPLHSWKTPRQYEKLRPLFLEAGVLAERPWGSIIEARLALELLLQVLKDDPFFVVP